MLPDGVRAVIKKDSYDHLPIFDLIRTSGNIAEEMMYNTYNMGIGMMLTVDPADADKAIKAIEAAGEKAYKVGYTEEGKKGVTLL